MISFMGTGGLDEMRNLNGTDVIPNFWNTKGGTFMCIDLYS